MFALTVGATILAQTSAQLVYAQVNLWIISVLGYVLSFSAGWFYGLQASRLGRVGLVIAVVGGILVGVLLQVALTYLLVWLSDEPQRRTRFFPLGGFFAGALVAVCWRAYSSPNDG